MKTQEHDFGAEVFQTLEYIIDPEIGINIVDLGLVYKVSLDGDTLEVELTLTTPGCPMSGTIVTAAEQILLKRFPNLEIKVSLVWSPPWSPDLISAEGQRLLENT